MFIFCCLIRGINVNKNNINFFFAFKCNYAYAQSLLKNKDAKKVLKSSGISEKKAKEIFNEILDENEIPNSNNVNKYNNSTQNENLQLEKIYQAEKSINQNEIKISENNTLLEEDNSLNEIVQTPAKKFQSLKTQNKTSTLVIIFFQAILKYFNNQLMNLLILTI